MCVKYDIQNMMTQEPISKPDLVLNEFGSAYLAEFTGVESVNSQLIQSTLPRQLSAVLLDNVAYKILFLEVLIDERGTERAEDRNACCFLRSCKSSLLVAGAQ